MRIPKAVLMLPAAVGVVAGLFLFGWLAPRSWFYRDRRPTRLGRIANASTGLWSGLGGPPAWQVLLDVPGWRTGAHHTIPVVIGEHAGRQYLVSMLGERSPWVRSLRANAGHARLRHGRTRDVRLIEVPAAERAPILRAYLQRALGARPHFAIAYDAPVEAFEALAADYPVFRIEEARSMAPREGVGVT